MQTEQETRRRREKICREIKLNSLDCIDKLTRNLTTLKLFSLTLIGLWANVHQSAKIHSTESKTVPLINKSQWKQPEPLTNQWTVSRNEKWILFFYSGKLKEEITLILGINSKFCMKYGWFEANKQIQIMLNYLIDIYKA